MLLFRSEEHLDRWRAPRNLPPDGAMPLSTMWKLADRWYRDRLDPGWRRRTADEADAVFRELGLTSDFWRLQH